MHSLKKENQIGQNSVDHLPSQMTVKQYLNSLRFFQYVFSVGLLSSAGFLGYLLNSMEAIPLLEDTSMFSILNVLCIAFAISIVGAAIFLFNTTLSRVEEHQSLLSKLKQFKNAFIIRSAMIEGAGVVSAVIFFLTASLFPVYVFTGCLLILIVLAPRKKEIKKALRLSMDESLKIDQDLAVITDSNELLFKNRLN